MPSQACRRLCGIFAPDTLTNTIATRTAGSSRNSVRLQKMVNKFKTSSESDKFRSRHDIYSNTVLRLAKYKKISMIQEIIEYQKNFEDIRNETFTSRLIILYGQAGLFDNARKLFDEMPKLKYSRTVYSFNALLSACIDAGKFSEFERIVKEVPHKLGTTLDVISYNIIIKGFCKMGALDSGALVLEEMVKKGMEPNVITFKTLLNGFYGNRRFVDGEKIWDRMVKMNVSPDIRSYNAKLLGLALEKRMKEAVELVEEMRYKRIELDLFSFNALIKGFVMDENLEEAKRWYGEMRKCDCAPDKVTFETLVPFLCDKGEMDFACEVCEEIFKSKCSVDVKMLQLVVDGLVTQSKTRAAERIVQLGKKAIYIRGSLTLHDAKMPNQDSHTSRI